jgi:biotin synthase-related radical SAM superfamily protein
LGFFVFSAGCGAHGGNIRERRRIGNALSQNLAKMEKPARKIRYNYAGLFMIFGQGEDVCIAVCVCVAKIGPKLSVPVRAFRFRAEICCAFTRILLQLLTNHTYLI